MSFSLVLHLETCVVILYLTIKHNRGFFGPASYHVRAMFGPCSVSFGYLSGRGRFVFDVYNRRKDEDGTKKVRIIANWERCGRKQLRCLEEGVTRRTTEEGTESHREKN